MEPLNPNTINEIRELAGGEDIILVELFQSFLEDGEELTSGITQATQSNDYEKLKFDVHTLKGLCGTIGATPLFEVCKVLNDELKSGIQANAGDHVDEINRLYGELTDHIKSNYQV